MIISHLIQKFWIVFLDLHIRLEETMKYILLPAI